MYSYEDRLRAVRLYLKLGRRMNATLRQLGYPTKNSLKAWCDDNVPRSHAEKQQAVIALNTYADSGRGVAAAAGVSRQTLYNWHRQLLGHGPLKPMIKTNNETPLEQQREVLLKEQAELQAQNRRLRMENEILEKAGDLIKKDAGINPFGLTNREKQGGDALRSTFPLADLLDSLKLARSTYFYQRLRQRMSEKYALACEAIRAIFDDSYRCYGYRRIDGALRRDGVRLSEKVVRRLMAEEQLIVKTPRRRRFSTYAGDPTPAVSNLLNRDFHASAPNTKWLTDLTEIHIPAGKVYVSPIVDCFDGRVVAWNIGTSPDANLVNNILDHAVKTLQPGEYALIHTDRGSHYRWPEWIRRPSNAKLTRLMSRKGGARQIMRHARASSDD